MQKRTQPSEAAKARTRRFVHLGFAALFMVLEMVFRAVDDPSMIWLILKLAAYTYGPLLGLFAFAIFSKRPAPDRWAPLVAVAALALCWVLDANQAAWLNAWQVGRSDGSAQAQAQALAQAQAGMCEGPGRVAGALRLVGDHATAIATLEQAEALAREAARAALPALSGAERGRMLLLLSAASTLAGDALDGMRNGVAAREVFQGLVAAGSPGPPDGSAQAQALAQAQAGMCEGLGRVAGALRLVGDHATAIATLEQAEALAREAGLMLPLALVLRQIGVCCSLVGRHRHAQICLDEAETLLQTHGSPADRLQARLSTLNARNRLSEALPAESDERRLTLTATLPDWQSLAEACAAAGQQRLAVMARGNHAITLAELGRHAEAITEFLALEPQCRSLGMRPNEGLCLGKLAISQLALGDTASARASAQRAEAVLRDGGALDDLQETLEALSTAEAACGDPVAALSTLRRVRELDRRKSDAAARGAVAQRELRIELARLSNQWARHATTDALTGLGNRRALEQWMEQQLPRVERGLPLCVLLMDLDHFKWVNDSFGHATGDEVLRRVAGLIGHSCRDGDLAVRYGGEEFVLALAGVGIEAAAAVAERLRAAIAGQPWGGVAAGLRVSVSIGVAAAVETATVPELFALADQRLYAAKLGGRDRVVSLG